MINNSELRLGNIVKYEGEYHIVNMLIAKGIGINGELHKEDDIYPVDLFEDILLKCGFETYETRNESFFCYYQPNHNYRIEYYKRENKFWFAELRELQYLHQLQNLYFALTGQELTVNL